MSNILKERPQTQKEFDPRKQDHGTRSNSWPNHGDTAYAKEASWKAQAAEGVADIDDGIAEYGRMPISAELDAEEFLDASSALDAYEEENELEQLKAKYPGYNNLTPLMLDYIDDHRKYPEYMDEDTTATLYANFLSHTHDGTQVDINDAHTLLSEVLYELRDDTEAADNRKEDEAYELNETVYNEEAKEDAAHDMNDAINRVARGEDRRSVDAERPTHRTRNRNLVRMVENLVDPEEEK